MKRSTDIVLRANVLPTVIVATLLMAITVLVLLSVWETESQLFARNSYTKARHNDVLSTFTLYESHPEIYEQAGDNLIILYDSVEQSRVRLSRRQWGLYEILTAESVTGGAIRTAMMGLRPQGGEATGFYYADNGGALVLTGNSNLLSKICAPKKGIVYGQMKSVFFSGAKISPAMIKVSVESLPEPAEKARLHIKELFNLCDEPSPPLFSDSITHSFLGSEAAVYRCPDSLPGGYWICGNAILTGDHIHIDSTCVMEDVLLVARKITIGRGFRGSIQAFATDSMIVREGACMEYPSGLYSARYAQLGDGSRVNGYVVVMAEKQDLGKANYTQSRTAIVRGVLYVDGNAQLQGIVSGPAYLSRAVYYSADGYHKDMIMDLTVLGNEAMAQPLWLSDGNERSNIKWLR